MRILPVLGLKLACILKIFTLRLLPLTKTKQGEKKVTSQSSGRSDRLVLQGIRNVIERPKVSRRQAQMTWKWNFSTQKKQ